MSNSLPHQLPEHRRNNSWIIALMLLVVILICLGFASAMTTTGFWDGMFPAGEYHLKIQDETGKPVQGAILNVFAGKTKSYSFEYPIDNYFSEGGLVSDENGVIVALHKPRGFEFGGGCWSLFWIFPICSSSPQFNFQISADGYRTIKFSTNDLFEPAYNDQSNASTSVLLENGEEVKIPVYELKFVLEK